MADTNQILKLAAIIRKVDGNHSKGAAALAESILDHPGFRAALADEPAVPQGREPAAADLEKEFRYWWKETYGSPYFGTVPLVAVLLWTECVLARWGNPAPQPAAVTGQPSDGEVAELTGQLIEAANGAAAMGWDKHAQSILRAAELLQRQVS